MHTQRLLFPIDLTPPAPPPAPPSEGTPRYDELSAPGITDEKFTITLKKRLASHDRGRRRVYRATMTVDSTQEKHDVVCKVAFQRRFCERLQKEADWYTDPILDDLHGVATPKSWGCFRGETDEGLTTVLVLADHGEELRVPFEQEPQQFRLDIASILFNLHNRGIAHGDFKEHHIVVKQVDEKFQPVLVDFSQMHLHRCPYKITVFDAYSPEPDPDLICSELLEGIDALHLWRPEARYFNYRIPFEHAGSPEEIMESVPRSRFASERECVVEAYRAYNELVDWYETREKWEDAEVRIKP